MSNPQADAPESFDRLNDLNDQIGHALLSAIGDQSWDRARFMVGFSGTKNYAWSIRFRNAGEKYRGVLASKELEALSRQLRVAIPEVTGHAPARYRFEIDADGEFDVKYFYDHVEGRVQWGWPDDDEDYKPDPDV